MSLICHKTSLKRFKFSYFYMKNIIPRTSAKALITVIFAVFAFTSQIFGQDGAKLFKAKCATCHASHTTDKITGPGLKGIFERAPKGDWLHKWILNSENLIKAGDPYAVKIFNENNKTAMTVFEGDLNDKDVDAILAFIKGPPPAGGDKTTTSGTTTGDGQLAQAQQGTQIEPLYLTLGVIVILLILIGAFRSIRTALQNSANRAE